MSNECIEAGSAESLSDVVPNAPKADANLSQGIFSRSEFLIESEVRSAESIEARSTGSLSDVAPKARAGGCESRLVLILAKRVSDRAGGIYIYIYSY